MEKKIQENLKYLHLLSKQFPTIHEASTEIINLEAIMNLPKGTEHFLSDVHGEDEAFMHIVNSGSGIIRKKIEDVFGATITLSEKRKLATLMYYPKEVLHKKVTEFLNDDTDEKDWYEVTLHRLVLILKEVSSKYTRSKVRKALPEEFQYIIEELLYQQERDDKDHYYNQVIRSIIDIERAKAFIIAISEVIQQLSVDHLHLIGDIFDRGPNPDIIIDKLMEYHSVDIQWGNHDIVWMGAAAGSKICILSVIRICARYGQLGILEENYGINLISIAKYGYEQYDEVEDQFYPLVTDNLLEDEVKMCAQINKAATILLFKLEDQLVDRSPIYEMSDRKLLSKVNFDDYTIEIDGKIHEMQIKDLHTVNKDNPSELTEEETVLLNKLQNSFLNNIHLQRHVAFLFEQGSIYTVYNGNLLYHGCIPLNDDGTYTVMNFDGEDRKGRALLDEFESRARQVYAKRDTVKDESERDIFWFLWSGSKSSLFGKKGMKTFERTFIKDKSTHVELKNGYYEYILLEETCKSILKDFDLDPDVGRIINGHVPVKVSKGEKPVKSGGRLIVIDGGLSKAYQEVTGIAGYTFIFNSHGMLLAAHEPFTSAQDAIDNNVDMIHELEIVYQANRRIIVGDTDIGKKIESDVQDLKLLVKAYRLGIIKTLLY